MPSQPYLVDIDDAGFASLPCCGIKSAAHPGRLEKKCWMRANAEFGLRARTLMSPDGQACGYIEYVPGEFAWRGVDAAGYMFIHCVWIYSRQHQRKGWGTVMIDACIEDAKKAGLNGVAVMTREGPWMADRRLFQANGFASVDKAPPDYELLVRKLKKRAPDPAFKSGWDQKVKSYGAGLTIIRSSQCPHIAKFASDIAQAADEYHLQPRIVELKSWRDAQDAPTPYAIFALLSNGRVIADHQISRTRFRNIMRTLPMPLPGECNGL